MRVSSLLRYSKAGGIGLLLSWAVWYMWPGREVYMTCREVEAFYVEKLELYRGRFRYWMYSDVGGSDPSSPRYPLTGDCTVEGSRLILHHPTFQNEASVRMLDRVNGVPVAWRSDGWEHWNEKRKIHPYGVMIRTSVPVLPFMEPRHPSLEWLERP